MSAPQSYYADDSVTLYHGDSLAVLREMPDASVDCCVTSPPYFGLRDYGVEGQYGLEASPADYVETMRVLFAEVRRVVVDDGTLWLNLGDSYSGSWGNQGRKPERGTQRPINGGMLTPVDDDRYPTTGSNTGAIKPGAPPAKNLIGIPWRVAFALQDDGWILRNDIIWAKPNGMPSSVTDRVANKHEHVFMFSKAPHYWFDLDPIREGYDGDRAISRRARTGATNKENSGKTAWPPVDRRPEGTSGNARPQSKDREAAHPNGRNPGDVWSIPTQPFTEAHFAVMPLNLAERCVQAGCKPDGTVLDPFSGSGTTGLAAARNGRAYVGIDLSTEYLDLSLRTRLAQSAIDFGESA